MTPQSEPCASENEEPNGLGAVFNGNGAEQVKDFDSLDDESSFPSIHRGGHDFHDVIQLKQEYHTDLPAVKISEMMKLNSLENASTQSLFSIVNKILDESIEQKNGDISLRVGSLLKRVVHEIERHTTVQADNFRNHFSLYKAREEKYQSRLQVLETLATGTSEENEVVMNQLQRIKIEKTKIEEKKKLEELDVARLTKEKDKNDAHISVLKQELELAKSAYNKRCLELETQANETKAKLEKKLVELEYLLSDSRKKVKELEAFSEHKYLRWKQKELVYKSFIDSQYGSLQALRVDSDSIKKEVLRTQRAYMKEFNYLGVELKELTDAAENYHMVLAENRKLYNEVQDLRGNIRVYCRIRPFLQGQSGKQTTVEYMGENGELVIMNPKQANVHRIFKFNKVFGPTATQEEVFIDTQPLIRSVLDGYNVCIFAYGQTGSGKTYTMTGPNASSKEDWGVNYRALNDLFCISQSRKSSIIYEVGVQMVEIYNEQVRDLLSNDSTQKRLGIWNSTQPNGLAVPDASMHAVRSTTDVLELMNIGLINRAVGATALNERSSRSHSVLTVHVRGTDLKSGAVLRGSLHLVDLAGSERVDRSEATGDRLREAQHINKSLSALGDVVFALAQKSSHVPYRNSKLTQLLQSSLGGQAKTLMFVQLNPDTDSYSETISTLKFAERVSGVELGAAKSNKEGRGVRELMEQVTSLKDAVGKKDEEIGRLRLLKANNNLNGERLIMSSPRRSSSSPRCHSLGASQSNRTPSRGKLGVGERAASDFDNSSEYSDKHSEAGSQQSMEELRHHNEFFRQSRLAAAADGVQSFNNEGNGSLHTGVDDGGQNYSEDLDLLGFNIADSEERLSDISDSGLSMGTETDGSMCSIVEYTLFPETTAKPPSENTDKSNVPNKLPKPQQKKVQSKSSQLIPSKSSRVSSSSKKPPTGSSSTTKTAKRWQ